MLLATGLGGCVQRVISITSEPSGALVHLNDREVGRTPVEVPFTFYGTYDVRLEREGCEPMWTTGEAEMPWWEAPPVDLLAEALPGAKSEVSWHYELEPEKGGGDPGTSGGQVDELVEHAKQMRVMVEEGW